MEDALKDGWRQKGETLVAAVSGGPDSMALLHMLCRWRDEEPFPLVAAHVNHMFRGAESAAEAVLVRSTAERWGAVAETADIDLPAYIAETGMNPQEAARERRYAFLTETARRHGASKLILGHHADDQAETVVMRLLRGTGVGGLAGIPYRRFEQNVELIRPLLRITKRELLAYCERNGVPYAVDSSNLDRHYFRNSVRLDILPVLESYNPGLKESLVRLSKLAAEDNDYMEAEAAKVFAEIVSPAGNGFRWERRRFRSLHVALQRRLIKLILNCSKGSRYSLEFHQVERVLDAVAEDRRSVARIELGEDRVFVREYDELYAGPEREQARSFHYPLPDRDGELAIAETGHRLRVRRIQGAVSSPPGHRWEAFFDEDELRLPLIIRSRHPGDRMQPYGLNGTKKVQDMFVDAKVPRSERDRYLLLADGDGRVLWIAGLRRSGHAPVGAQTRSTLVVTVDDSPESMNIPHPNADMPS
ncbi:tRNA lysidine(34) synthetase TilS [Cohnella faecalis]|uniref:tRNA(Ile)-lysidine synthase n=2 Tax=Cohnella faecalis TaxID=2315694 RepID=A0A398CKF0_9BACL|nr:tRNA lysidine(34) synthetase TilS [Cohnella faecalis]